MFGALLSRLTGPEATSLDPSDARLALAALLVRVARTDGHYASAEITQIDQILATRYGLDASTTTALRQEAEALEAEAPDTVRFTRAIKDKVSHEDRLAVIEALWRVVLADGVRDDAENALLRMVASLLGINDRDSNAARLRVSQG